MTSILLMPSLMLLRHWIHVSNVAFEKKKGPLQNLTSCDVIETK